MTRDEAINICLEALKEHEDGSDAWFDVMRDVAELKESKKKKPCEDVVSRKAVLNLAKDLTFKDVEGMEHYKYRCIAVEDVEELPPATPDLSSLREINEALTKRVKYLENMERYAMPGNLTSPILEKIRSEIIDSGAYEQEVNGKTEFLKGIDYCLGVIDKYKEG